MSNLHTWPIDVKRFLVDTAEMTNEEVGIYMRMLCYQWENGSVTSDTDRLPIRLPLNPQGGGVTIPPFVLRKFIKDQEGNLHNEKMELTRIEVLQKIDKQSIGGRKGAEGKWGNHKKIDGLAYGLPNGLPIDLPNGLAYASQSQSIYITDTKVSVAPHDFAEFKSWGLIKENTQDQGELYLKLTLEFYKLIKSNLESLNIRAPHIEKARVDKWLSPIRLMIESDKFSIDDIRESYRFLKKDSFWKQQIQTTENLRNHFTKILTKSRSTKDGNPTELCCDTEGERDVKEYLSKKLGRKIRGQIDAKTSE